MKKGIAFPSKNLRIQILLLLITAALYVFYFPEAFFHPNSILAGVTGDALKNYYTFAFHAVRDTDPLVFTGMQFPYGEHAVYTDCQPLLSGLLRLLPFTHNYVIGILHYLLFFSYILTPVILFRILKKLEVADLAATLFAISISILAPQFQKISGGHHGLAYGFMIPFCLLLCLKITEQASIRNFWYLICYNFLIYFLHPYMGLTVSLLSGLFLLIYLVAEKRKSLRQFFLSLAAVVLPLFGFKLFMVLSDKHGDRTSEPFGGQTILENADSLLAPDFGPFQIFLEKLFPSKIAHLESHAYLGFAIILLVIFTLVVCIRAGRRFRLEPKTLSLLLSALILLFIAFGWHQNILQLFHIKSQSLNQFRAASRFAWSFYYVLPIFLIVHLQKNWSLARFPLKKFLNYIAALVLVLNLIEAHAYFQKDRANFWKYRNVLNSDLLSSSEKDVIKMIKENKCQAIVPLPVFHIGSETYARPGADLSMMPAMLYSFHSGVSILGAAMSRTPINETVASLDLLNSYHNKHTAETSLNGQPFVILRTKDKLQADEDRLVRNFKVLYTNDEVEIGLLTQGEFLAPKFAVAQQNLNEENSLFKNIIFLENPLAHSQKKMSVTEYQLVYKLDSLVLEEGEYLVSYRINTSEIKPGQNPGLIVARRDQEGYRWEQQFDGRTVSGFYSGFQIMEYKVQLSNRAMYEFILQGDRPGFYTLENFLIHPQSVDTRYKKGDVVYWNNYPLNLP